MFASISLHAFVAGWFLVLLTIFVHWWVKKPKIKIVVETTEPLLWGSFDGESLGESRVDGDKLILTATQSQTVQRVFIFYDRWAMISYDMTLPINMVVGDDYVLPLKLLFEQTTRDGQFARGICSSARQYLGPMV